jgi:hypothetical protein
MRDKQLNVPDGISQPFPPGKAILASIAILLAVCADRHSRFGIVVTLK